MKQFIAYKGQRFTIEWYYDKNEKSQALEYFLELTQNQKDKTFYLFKRMGDFGKILDERKFRFEGEKIYEFKPSPDRFLCFFFEGAKIIITNAFKKKTQKLPPKEKEKALKYMQDFKRRIEEGNYYE